MLGVRWADSERTEDVDFARAEKSVSLALPTNVELNADQAIKSLGMGFLPVCSLRTAAGATDLNPREPEFRLDFLTTLHRGGDKPFNHPRLGVTMQPLPFMEYLLEDLQQAVIFSGDTVVLVNLPSPARYALHKLIVLGERSGAYTTKSAKDLRQAGVLLALLKELRKSDVDRAWKNLVSRGKGWRSRVKPALGRLHRLFPALDAIRWLKLPSA